MLKTKRMDCGTRGDIMKENPDTLITEKWFLKQKNFIEENVLNNSEYQIEYVPIKDAPSYVFAISPKKKGVMFVSERDIFYYHVLLNKITSFDKIGTSKIGIIRRRRVWKKHGQLQESNDTHNHS